MAVNTGTTTKFSLQGLDCALCGDKIEQALQQAGFREARVNFATKSIMLTGDNLETAQAVIDRVDPQVHLVKIDRVSRSGGWPAGLSGKRVGLLMLSAVLYGVGLVLRHRYAGWPGSVLLLAAYVLSGANVIKQAILNLMRGTLFDENFLMTLATFGALALGELPEAASVMLLYNLGEIFQDLAVGRSRNAVQALMDVRPDYANLLAEDRTMQRVLPKDVRIGDLILVKPGEKIPLDGEVVEGSSFLDTAVLTGESVPKRVSEGEQVLAGSVNTAAVLILRVNKPYSESAVVRILDLLENAAARKAPAEKFITRFSRYYTPAVVLAAAGIAFGPPLFTGAALTVWVSRALTLLVISCPCALVISVPLSYFGGIGSMSRRGILVKGANYLDSLSKLDTVVFDKTGTLTKGVFRVSEIVNQPGYSREDLLGYAAKAEALSNHPIAKSIMLACRQAVNGDDVSLFEEHPGLGIKAVVNGKRVLAGNERLLRAENITAPQVERAGTLVHVAVDGEYAGYLIIADELRPDAVQALKGLRNLGVRRVVMLTGDSAKSAAQVARDVGVDTFYAGLLPEDKVQRLGELAQGLIDRRQRKIAFVGDGINDAPVIAGADLGIAMGGLGSDAAIEAADVVIMDDLLSKLPAAVEISRATRKIVFQNIVFALGVKSFFIVLGAIGLAGMWEAVFADVGVAVLAILNATRTVHLAV